MRTRLILFVITLFLGSTLWAQNSITDSLPFIKIWDQDLMHVGYRPWDGVTVTYQGKTEASNFGLSGRLANLLNRYPESSRHFQSFKSLNLAGNICWWGGVTLLGSGVFLPSVAHDASSSTLGFSVGIAVTGVISMVVAGALLPAGQDQLARSVNAFDRARLDELTR